MGHIAVCGVVVRPGERESQHGRQDLIQLASTRYVYVGCVDGRQLARATAIVGHPPIIMRTFAIASWSVHHILIDVCCLCAQLNWLVPMA